MDSRVVAAGVIGLIVGAGIIFALGSTANVPGLGFTITSTKTLLSPTTLTTTKTSVSTATQVNTVIKEETTTLTKTSTVTHTTTSEIYKTLTATYTWTETKSVPYYVTVTYTTTSYPPRPAKIISVDLRWEDIHVVVGGTLKITGYLVNIGDYTAHNVVLHVTYYQGNVATKKDITIGDISPKGWYKLDESISYTGGSIDTVYFTVSYS